MEAASLPSSKHESSNNAGPEAIPLYEPADSLKSRHAPESLGIDSCGEARPHVWMLKTGVFDDCHLPAFMATINSN